MPTAFDEPFRRTLAELFRLRRDVRRFRTDALPDGTVARLIATACTAPSVGLSQPWRFVSVDSPERRRAVAAEFARENAAATAIYDDRTAAAYADLKLAGLDAAPEQLAVFCEPAPTTGRGLGRQTMPETTAYSVVAAIQTLWLAARAEGIGVGWVSILRPGRVAALLDVPAGWQLVAYLCIGYPEADDDTPELERSGWERRVAPDAVWRRV